MSQPSRDQRTSLRLRRLFPAPRERVFRAWIEREALQQWFRPKGMEIVVSRLEAQVGGRFRFEGQGADGTRSVATGRYLEIRFPEKLVFTWASNSTEHKDTLVILEFIEHGASTEVILTHERLESDAMIALHQQGWGAALDQLASVMVVLT